ncbi:MAG TPA: terminase family protein [Allosphingosinicella sp.]
MGRAGEGSFRALVEALSPEEQAALVGALTLEEARAADLDWPGWAHDGQFAPDGEWSTWVVMGGRGFGKTMAGAQWVSGLARAHRDRDRPLRIALVAATLDEARAVMVEGPCGLLEVAHDQIEDWAPSLRRLRFAGGAEAMLFSGASPEALRGPEHDYAWCDELAKWPRAQASWDMLQIGLRRGPWPRALVTTTPRPGPVLRGIMAAPGTVVTGGPIWANPHLPARRVRLLERLHAGTRLERQELRGELLTDNPGALWTEALLERCRAGDRRLPGGGAPADGCSEENGDRPRFLRLVIAVDPPTGDGTCGIIACARDSDDRAHVLADHSVTGRSPEGWSRAVADSAAMWSRLHPGIPVLVVAEQNQGGRMVRSVLGIADPGLAVKPVTAVQGKTDRAAPVAMLFEAGQVVLHGRFPELEAQLCGMIAGGDYEGPGASPDRADAMVWGLTELMLQKERAEPRITSL